MLDPNFLLAALIPIYNSLKDNPVFSGIIGNRADKMVEIGYNRIKGIWDKNQLPQNADLLRALREAHFEATIYFTKSVMDKISLLHKEHPSENYKDQLQSLNNYVLPYLREEKKGLKKEPEPNHNDPAFIKIGILLSGSESTSLPEIRRVLKEETKNRLIDDIKTGAAVYLPSLFVDMLYNGWEEGGIMLDWFDIMTLKFSEILKNPNRPRVKQAFESRLLSDIHVDIHEIDIKINDVINVISRSTNSIKQVIEDNWEKLNNWQDEMRFSIEHIDKGILKANEQLHDLTVTVKRLSDYADEKMNNTITDRLSLHSTIQKIIELDEQLANVNTDLINCKFDLQNADNKYINTAYQYLLKEVESIESNLKKKKSELNYTYDISFDYIFLKRQVTLILEDILGKNATCTDIIFMRVLDDTVTYEDVFTNDGYIDEIKTSPGNIESIKKEGGNVFVRTKLDREYKSGEFLEYSSSCKYNDSHMNNSEYFMVWSGYPTKHLTIKVIFPSDRPCKKYHVSKKSTKFDRKLVESSFPVYKKHLQNKDILELDISEPDIFDKYVLEWEW